MTQVQFTLSEAEVLQVLSGDREEAFKMLVKKILDQAMLAESAEQLGADRHERSDVRQDYRNGVRTRKLTTMIGTIELEVPRHRNEPFHTMIFDNYQRSEPASTLGCCITSRKPLAGAGAESRTPQAP